MAKVNFIILRPPLGVHKALQHPLYMLKGSDSKIFNATTGGRKPDHKPLVVALCYLTIRIRLFTVSSMSIA